MRIGILGPLEVRGSDGAPITIGGGGPRALLVRLALAKGRVVSPATLCADLWPEAPPADPTATLQSLVARLRRALDADTGVGRAAIGSRPTGYLLDLPPDAVDAWEFERLVGAAGSADPARAAVLLREALALWRGEPPFDGPRLAELRLTAVEDLADTGATGLVPELTGLCAAHPLRERAHVRLVRALCAEGRQAEALRVHERIRRALADELGSDPGQELREAHLAALRAEAAPSGGNVPARWTSFVGRESDLEQVGSRLRDNRLVTLTGPGGVGKTRLALEVAARLPVEAWVVELGAVTDPDRVVPAVLALLGRPSVGVLPEPGPADAVDRLLEIVANRRMVLVLDNCEHLVDTVAVLVDRLLSRTAALRVLATSREPLGLTGEALHPVSTLDSAARVALFADRACAVRPGFTVTPDVERVCRELDGLPLAIELAAARLRSMTPGQLAERIGDRFRLLDRGDRTAAARHRTLRAVVDWSWDLLADDERALLAGLSVFAGGATADAVRDARTDDDPLDLLSALVDKSLVVVAEHDGEVRYGLLATVREYAAEKLGPATAAVRDRHAECFATWAETAEPEVRGHDQRRWLARLDRERGNLDAALDHALATGRVDLALRLFTARLWPWFVRGARREAVDRAVAVLRAAGPVAPAGLEDAHVLCRLANGEYEPSADDGDALTRIAHPALFAAWTFGAWMPDDPLRYATSMADRFSGNPDPWLKAFGHLMHGIVAAEMTPGGTPSAERHLRSALTGFDRAGDRWGRTFACYELSVVLDNRGDAPGAVAALDDARASSAVLGGDDALLGPVMLLTTSARLRARAGLHDDTELDLAREIAERTGAAALARVLHARADVARHRGDWAAADRWLDESWAVVRAIDPADDLQPTPHFVVLLHSTAAHVRAHLGRAEEARDRHRVALELAAAVLDGPLRALVVENAAQWCLDQGFPEQAAAALGAASALRGVEDTLDPDVLALRARCVEALGEDGYREASERGRVEPVALAAIGSR
ncbi:BTAD domain-containing putative transcriptional regulator [Umezawaea sp. Da 62-37]|uniref:BTAD domain-containing putative transcriptional regulator n=1 Tax=Umezawaea sp. Da 62-37 TaxID=3075927 RepID=UPI0028F7391C|nr:BTAD domain-containing putative transcriptional regulator [Umezawaea sp. Da 62-37]WNV82690.1 BTAD domain-containing putative transcriptional regulator [Umezawaea sp. Da 62-37]